MEAIMKAFEKMAKREERRKEALARLDKKHTDVKVVFISISFCSCLGLLHPKFLSKMLIFCFV